MKLPNWLSRLLARFELSRSNYVVQPFELPAPPEPPPQPAPLSCFVQGIIRSLETEPDQWERAPYSRNEYRHKTSHLSIYHQSDGLFEKEPGELDDFEVTLDERVAIYAALKANVLIPQEREQESYMDQLRAEHVADLAARKAAFEKLGCPPTT